MHESDDTFLFDSFRLDRRRRVLYADDSVVPLHGRAFDILAFLIDSRDRVVGRDEIVAAVWRGLEVSSNNLTVQMSALRRTLAAHGGERLIVTVAGTGYRFVGDLVATAAPTAEVTAAPEPGATGPDGRPVAELKPRLFRIGAQSWMWVALGLLAVVLPLGYLRWQRPPSPRLSIVVLPFRNLGSDIGQTYLADAITDDLTTDLAHLPGSTVVARESADVYKSHVVPAQQIGRALDVRYLLDGSLTGEGSLLHINAQLTDATTAKQLWTDNFDVTRDDLAQAREAIVRHIGGALNFQLVQIESARSLHERPHSPDAVDLFLRARSILDGDSGLDGLSQAQALLERAIAAAPDYADAIGELGIVLALKIGNFDDPDEWHDHAELVRTVDHGTVVGSGDPLVIASRGRMAWEDYHCDQAIPAFQMALALDPDAVEASDGLAQCQFELGQMAEMIASLQTLQRMDPVAPGWARRESLMGFAYLMLGRLPDAFLWLNRAQANIAGPANGGNDLGWQEWNSLYLIAARWEAGERSAAQDLYADYARVWPHRTVWQINAFNTRAIGALAGYGAFLDALRNAGMPRFANENQDFGVSAPTVAGAGNDFAPTPLTIPGGQRVDTAAVHALLAQPIKPLVLDVGSGAAVIPGVTLLQPENAWADENALLNRAVHATTWANVSEPDRKIIVMGDGPFGWLSYDAALHVIAMRAGTVLWYRGGEEAWAAANNPYHDLRLQ